MPATSERRILAVGGSRAVAMPPEWLSALGLRVGDAIDVMYDSVVLVKPKDMDLDPDFLVKEFTRLARRR
jgi:antitoxin component of MazEF toxin-antitoxin module